jgi:lipid A disaccharide synthetase
MLARDSSLQFVLSVADPCLEGDILQTIRQHKLESSICLSRDSRRSIAASDLVIVCSGTADLPNLLAGESTVVELRQTETNASRLIDEAWSLLIDSDRQIRTKEKLRPLKTQLGEKGVIEGAARKILEKVTRSVHPLELKNL